MEIIYHPTRGFAENVLTICSFYILASFVNPKKLSLKKFMLGESNIKKKSFEVKITFFVSNFSYYRFYISRWTIANNIIAFPYIKYILDINHLFLNIFHKPRLRILILVKGFKSLEKEKNKFIVHTQTHIYT